MSRSVPGVRVLSDALRTAIRTGTIDLGVSMLLVLGLGFVQNLALARVLGPAGVGHMAVVYSTLTVAALLGTAGLTTAILRYGAAAPSAEAAWGVFRASISACLAIAAVATLATIAFARSPWWPFDPVAGQWMLVTALAVPAQALGSCSVHYLQSRDRMREKAIVEFLGRLVTVISVLGGAWQRGFEGAAIGYTVGSVAAGAIAFALAVIDRPRGPANALVSTRELLRFGSWGLLTNALGLGLLTADVFCVSALVGDAAQVGVYFLAVQLQQIVGIPVRAYLDARFPEMTRLSADPPALRSLWRRMRWQLVAVSAAGSVGLAVVAPFALSPIFGADFAASASPLTILLAGQVARSFGDAAGRSMFAAGWVEGNFWLSALSAALTIGGNLALIPVFGIAGAALGTALANGVWAIATTFVCNRFDASRGARS